MRDETECDEDPPSGPRRTLTRLAERVVAKLTEMAEELPAYKADEVQKFVSAAVEANWLVFYARVFDKRVELELSKTIFST